MNTEGFPVDDRTSGPRTQRGMKCTLSRFLPKGHALLERLRTPRLALATARTQLGEDSSTAPICCRLRKTGTNRARILEQPTSTNWSPAYRTGHALSPQPGRSATCTLRIRATRNWIRHLCFFAFLGPGPKTHEQAKLDSFATTFLYLKLASERCSGGPFTQTLDQSRESGYGRTCDPPFPRSPD